MMLKNIISLKKILVAVAFMLTLQSFETKAAPGGYDPSFGTGGAVEFQMTNDFFINRTEVQKDGKILVAGYRKTGQTRQLVLRRHNRNGSLDTAFGFNGEAVEQLTSPLASYKYINLSAPSDIAVQPDGGILIGGNRLSTNGTKLGIAVWRFTPAGFLDNSFGKNGRKDFSNPLIELVDPTAAVETVIMTKSTVFGVEKTKIFVLCTYKNVGSYGIESGTLAESSGLIRLNLDGSYDTNFGQNGKIRLNGEFNDIAIYKPPFSLTDNLIYLAGIGEDSTLTVWRYTSVGLPDTSFGNAGRSSLPYDSIKKFKDVVVQKDGRVLLSGDVNPTAGIIISYVFRMQSNGMFEQQFGNTTTNGAGVISSPVSFNMDIGLQSDGKFIVGRTFSTERYLPDSSQDTAYVPSGGVNELLFFVIQKDNKLVAVANNWLSLVGYRSYTLRRLLAD